MPQNYILVKQQKSVELLCHFEDERDHKFLTTIYEDPSIDVYPPYLNVDMVTFMIDSLCCACIFVTLVVITFHSSNPCSQ